MAHATEQQTEIRSGNDTRFPLNRELRVAVDTATAAYHLGRAPQTLRLWACRENGPIQPMRVHGRLLWPTAEIRRLLGVA
jgi:hypothetical protein